MELSQTHWTVFVLLFWQQCSYFSICSPACIFMCFSSVCFWLRLLSGATFQTEDPLIWDKRRVPCGKRLSFGSVVEVSVSGSAKLFSGSEYKSMLFPLKWPKEACLFVCLCVCVLGLQETFILFSGYKSFSVLHCKKKTLKENGLSAASCLLFAHTRNSFSKTQTQSLISLN